MLIPEHKCGIKLHPRIYSAALRGTLRRVLVQQQKNKCYWCGCGISIWWRKNPDNRLKRIRVTNAEIDHIIPRCAGGSNDVSNLCASCQNCNRTRGTLYMAGVRSFIIIGQESPTSILDRYKREFSSNHKTRKHYNAIKARENVNNGTSPV